MRDTGHAAVVLHRKCFVTKQMQSDRLGRRLKDADIKKNKFIGKRSSFNAGRINNK